MNLSPRVSFCRSWRQHDGQGSLQCLARKALWSQVGSGADEVLTPAGSASLGNAKGDQRGMQQHSGVWSTAVSAVARSLPQLYLESGVPSGSLGKCLGTPDAKWGFPQGPFYGWSCSAHMAVLITCADILGVFPCWIGLV